MESSLLTYENDVFSYFAFYSTIVLLKMGSVIFLIGYHRQKNDVFMNEEDIQMIGLNKEAKTRFDHPDVERARRIHQNDIETIPMFIFIALLYVLSDPNSWIALWHFRIFTGARVMYMFAYEYKKQPARTICYMTGMLTTLSMALQILFHVPCY